MTSDVLWGAALGLALACRLVPDVAEWRDVHWLRRQNRRLDRRLRRTRAVELRRTPRAPAHPAPTGRSQNVPVGAPKQPGWCGPRRTGPAPVDAAERDVAASTPQTLADTVGGDWAVSASPHGRG